MGGGGEGEGCLFVLTLKGKTVTEYLGISVHAEFIGPRAF